RGRARRDGAHQAADDPRPGGRRVPARHVRRHHHRGARARDGGCRMIPPGVAVITDGEGAGGWSHQIAIVRRLRPELLRVRTPIGFGFSPARLQVLLESAPTIRTVLLCGEDGDVTPERTAADLERWLPLVDRFPQVRWVVELGNEPNLVGGLDIWEHRYYALMTLQRLPRQLGRPQLHWAISLPTTLAPSRDLLLHRDAHGCVADLVD